MAISVLLSPGCGEISSEYLDRALAADELIIDAGEIYKVLTRSTGIPSENVPALRLALGVRATAIRHAREDGINATIRTGNGDRASIQRLQAQAGPGTVVKVLHIDREEACRRVKQIVKSKDRQLACEQGLGRYFDRYVPEDTDQVVK